MDFAPALFSRSPRESQKSTHKIAVTKVMIHIDKRTRCRELARGGRGEIDFRGSAAKHEAKALGVIIKNQNVLHVPAEAR